MKKTIVTLACLGTLSLAACGSAMNDTRQPSNIKSYDVIDNRGLRHTCFENVDTGSLSCT